VQRGYEVTRDTIQRRLAYSPYYLPAWPLTANTWAAREAVDMPDDEFFAAFYTRLTEFPPEYWPLSYRRYPIMN
jgi:hypothetical protein